VCRPLIGLLYQPRMIDDDECEAFGGMRIGRGNRSTRRKSAPVLLCPQIPYGLGSNPGRSGGKPATNRLSYAAACAEGSVHGLIRDSITQYTWRD
jgi:hypothetical protein